MKITYFKSIICPRCIPTNRLLKQVKQEHPEIEIEEIEILTHMSRAKQADVHHVPTLIASGKRFFTAPSMQELLSAINEPVFD